MLKEIGSNTTTYLLPVCLTNLKLFLSYISSVKCSRLMNISQRKESMLRKPLQNAEQKIINGMSLLDRLRHLIKRLKYVLLTLSLCESI